MGAKWASKWDPDSRCLSARGDCDVKDGLNLGVLRSPPKEVDEKAQRRTSRASNAYGWLRPGVRPRVPSRGMQSCHKQTRRGRITRTVICATTNTKRQIDIDTSRQDSLPMELDKRPSYCDCSCPPVAPLRADPERRANVNIVPRRAAAASRAGPGAGKLTGIADHVQCSLWSHPPPPPILSPSSPLLACRAACACARAATVARQWAVKRRQSIHTSPRARAPKRVWDQPQPRRTSTELH